MRLLKIVLGMKLCKSIDELNLLKDINYENALKITNKVLTDLNLGEPFVVNDIVYSAQFPNYNNFYIKVKYSYLLIYFSKFPFQKSSITLIKNLSSVKFLNTKGSLLGKIVFLSKTLVIISVPISAYISTGFVEP